MIDAERVARATGWAVEARGTVASTNDEAARLRNAGAPPRTVVVAEAQTAGRGRLGRRFSSPPGGLYASLLVDARAEDLPGPLTAAVAVAAAEAVEAAAAVPVSVKWPNDLWIGRKKAAGILLETAGADRPVIAGIGINVRDVPPDLPPAVLAETTCLDRESDRRVDLEDLLVALLPSVDRALEALVAASPSFEAEWRRRLVLVGERVRYGFDGRTRRGRLVDVRLAEGLWLEDDEAGLVLRAAAHVQDVRPE